MTKYGHFVLGLLILFWGCDSSKKESEDFLKSKRQQPKSPVLSSVDTNKIFVYECGDSLQFTVVFAGYQLEIESCSFRVGSKIPGRFLPLLEQRQGGAAANAREISHEVQAA